MEPHLIPEAEQGVDHAGGRAPSGGAFHFIRWCPCRTGDSRLSSILLTLTSDPSLWTDRVASGGWARPRATLWWSGCRGAENALMPAPGHGVETEDPASVC